MWQQSGHPSDRTKPRGRAAYVDSLCISSAPLHVMMKILTKITVAVVSLIIYNSHVSPTIALFDILSADRQGNSLLSRPLSLQVLDRRWHSDASLELPKSRLLQCAQQVDGPDGYNK